MNILGKKVILRALEPKDNQMLCEIINDAETEYMLGGASFPISFEGQCNWLASLKNDPGTLRCAIVPKDQENAVGTIILSDIDYKNGTAEVHIKLSPKDVRGKGYGTDSIMTVCKYAFQELRLNCVYAKVSEKNEISQKLFEKCRFTKEGIMRSRMFKKGEYINWVSFSILSDEYIGED